MWIDILLVAGIFIAHFFGAISGGVGLLVRPLLIFAGVPPAAAIGSSRVANLGTRAVALRELNLHRGIDWRLAAILAVPSLVGGVAGAQLVTLLAGPVIEVVMALGIVALAVFMFLKPHIGVHEIEVARTWVRTLLGQIAYAFVVIVSTVTGGGGPLTSLVIVLFFGNTYISSAAVRKVAGYAGTIGGSVIFIASGAVSWYHVLLLLVAGSVGNFLGVRYGVKRGERWVRNVMLSIIVIMGVALLVI